MRHTFLLLSTLAATLTAFAPATLAQEQIDAVTEINGETPPADASKVYFNAENCADPGSTEYDVTLTNASGVIEAYLWAGTQNAGCELNSNRTDLQLLCRPIEDGTGARVGDNVTIFDLSLQDLIDTEIVNCDNSVLAGQASWIYSFRNQDPGGTEQVPVEDYGVAEIWVDVTPPEPLAIKSSLTQDGSQFTIEWSSPADSNEIQLYKLYRQDPGDAAPRFTNLTEVGTVTSFTVSADTLNLDSAAGESTSLFVTAVDMAAVTPGNGNEGDVADATATVVNAVATVGFCDDPNVDCSGCSVSPLMLSSGQPGTGLWVVGLAFALVVGRRLRR